MKVDFNEVVKERVNSKCVVDKESINDEMVNLALVEEKNEFALILSPNLMRAFKYSYSDLANFYVTGIFELGPSFLWAHGYDCSFLSFSETMDKSLAKLWTDYSFTEYSLITFSKEKTNKIKICALPRKQLENGCSGELVDDIDRLMLYYKDLEIFIKTAKVPDSLKGLVNTIPYKDFRRNEFDVRFYSRKYLGTLNSLKKQKTVLLKDLVEIIDIEKKRDMSKKTRQITSVSTLSYPLNIKKLSFEYGYFPLKKGDILVSADTRLGYFYLFDEDSQVVVSPANCYAVLRLKSVLVTAEYLFLYLNSGVFKNIIALSAPMLSLNPGIHPNWSELNDIPVYLPDAETPLALNEKLAQYYKYRFDKEYRPYLLKDAPDDYKDSQKLSKNIVKSDALGDEFRDRDKRRIRNNILNCICTNKKEYDITFPNGAYFASIILIGSILEAFLTDWASTIAGKDFIHEAYRKKKDDPKFLTLNDAICYIAKKRKKWTARNEADAIREMRNNIHARVFVGQNKKITKQECEKAFDRLEKIIQSRSGYGHSSLASLMNEAMNLS